jgi:hypothetical protein
LGQRFGVSARPSDDGGGLFSVLVLIGGGEGACDLGEGSGLDFRDGDGARNLLGVLVLAGGPRARVKPFPGLRLDGTSW